MSSLDEIEAAVVHLSIPEQKELFGFLVQRLRYPDGRPWDPVDDIIGCIAGEPEGKTSSNTDELLYGLKKA